MVKHGMHCLTTHFLCTKRMIEDRTICFHICEHECMFDDFINTVNDSKKEEKNYLFCVKTG